MRATTGRRHPRRSAVGVRVAARATLVVAITLALVACGTTIDDDGPSDAELTDGEGDLAGDDTSPLGSEEITDADAPVTTVAIAGTPAEVLAEIGVDMSRLSTEIAGEGDEDARLARILGSWIAIEDEIATTRPELVDGIQSTIDMARTAVDANRPADADKAFALLNDLIDSFTGDP